MISLRNSIKLASAKMSAKKGVTISTIAINTLLFSMLMILLIGLLAARDSINDFIREAGGDKYRVAVQASFPHSRILTKYTQPSNATIDEVRSYEQQYCQKKAEAAKANGETYDDSSIILALQRNELAGNDVPDEYRYRVNLASPIVQEMINNDWAEWSETANNKTDNLLETIQQYGASNFYRLGDSSYDEASKIGRLLNYNNARPIVDGVELLNQIQGNSDEYIANGIASDFYASVNDNLLEKYIPKVDGKLSGVPVVVSAYDLAELYGDELGVVTEEPKSRQGREQWLAEIGDKGVGYEYDVCYRNQTEQNMLSMAKQAAILADENKDNPNYQPRGIIYGLPTEACGDIPILADNRTESEKQAEATQATPAPVHYKIHFQVVGVINEKMIRSVPMVERSMNIEDYITGLLSDKVGFDAFGVGGIISSQMYETLPETQKIPTLEEQPDMFGDTPSAVSRQFSRGVIEFDSVDDARRFMSEQSCSFGSTDCDKPYLADQFSVNYSAMHDFSNLLRKIICIVVPIVVALSVAIVWFAVSRIISDSRHEIAVYRAVGAKKSDVVQIYITYAIILALLIFIVSTIITVIVLALLNSMFAPTITTAIASVLSLANNATSFTFASLNTETILAVVAIMVGIVLLCCLASLVPIVLAVRKLPVDDLREK